MKTEMTVKVNVETLFEGQPIELEFVREAIREKREREPKAEGRPEPIGPVEVADKGRTCEAVHFEAMPGAYEIILGIDRELTLHKKALEFACDDLCPDCTCCAVNYYLKKAEEFIGGGSC